MSIAWKFGCKRDSCGDNYGCSDVSQIGSKASRCNIEIVDSFSIFYVRVQSFFRRMCEAGCSG
jgi:hypothetical protein